MKKSHAVVITLLFLAILTIQQMTTQRSIDIAREALTTLAIVKCELRYAQEIKKLGNDLSLSKIMLEDFRAAWLSVAKRQHECSDSREAALAQTQKTAPARS